MSPCTFWSGLILATSSIALLHFGQTTASLPCGVRHTKPQLSTPTLKLANVRTFPLSGKVSDCVPVVPEHLAEITAIDPAAAGWAADEMLGVALWRIAHSSPEDGAAGNV